MLEGWLRDVSGRLTWWLKLFFLGLVFPWSNSVFDSHLCTVHPQSTRKLMQPYAPANSLLLDNFGGALGSFPSASAWLQDALFSSFLLSNKPSVYPRDGATLEVVWTEEVKIIIDGHMHEAF